MRVCVVVGRTNAQGPDLHIAVCRAAQNKPLFVRQGQGPGWWEGKHRQKEGAGDEGDEEGSRVKGKKRKKRDKGKIKLTGGHKEAMMQTMIRDRLQKRAKERIHAIVN